MLFSHSPGVLSLSTLLHPGGPNIHSTAYGKRGKAKIQGNMLAFKLQIISKLHTSLQLTFYLPKLSHVSTPSWKENWEMSRNFPNLTRLITQIIVYTLSFPYTEHTHTSPKILRRQLKVSSSYGTHLKIHAMWTMCSLLHQIRMCLLVDRLPACSSPTVIPCLS